MFQQETSRSKGFGYLNFNDQEEAERCLREMNNAVIDSKAIVLNKKKDSDFDTKANLIVKNLPKEMTQKELNELFTQFGQIGSCKLETF
jgi:RNA recognition motif-containing protein